MRWRKREKTAVRRCTYCGRELVLGENYWYINGAVLCAACLPAYARGDYESFCHVRGEEGADDLA